MGKFSKKGGKADPEVSTASLPDIIFMLLFFFMVTTVMRTSELMVSVSVPEATELTKLEKKSLVNYIYIGRPMERYESEFGTAPRIQLGNKFGTDKDIPLFLEAHRAKVSERERGLIYSSIRADGEVTMGIVSDIKTALRKAGQLKINYSARARAKDL